MINTATDHLRELLGPDTAALDYLNDEDSAHLLALFERAQHSRSVALNRGIDDALKALPWAVRRAVEKTVFGKGKR